MRRIGLGWLLFLAALPGFARGQGLQSNHGTLRAVPVAAEVSVDGKLEEWDVSAEMFSYGVRRLRERYSVKVAAMWDAQALYLGLRWRDPTPMINNVDVDASPGDGWMADSFQARFIVNGRQVHLTTCYSSKKDKTAAVIEYDAALNQAGRRVFVSAGKATKDESGFAQAFVAESDARGYVQELRIPWALLGKEFRPAAGGKIGFTGEYFWGNASGTTWPAVMWSDPINQKNPVRIVVYQNPGVWGEMELLGQGNLPRPTETEDEQRLAGTVPLRFEVPADATHFSVVIDDASGKRVRNLASHQRVEDYKVARSIRDREPASRSDAATTIEIPWDARPDGNWNPDRMLFLGEQVVSEGKYTARCIVHQGIGVTYAGSFYNPGTPPWPTANGTGAWGFDHTGPQAVAAMPRDAMSTGRVFLGWHHGECGVGFIGLDANGRKIWEWLRRGVGATHIATNSQLVYFTFHSGTHYFARVNPNNGDQVPFAGGKIDIALAEAPAGLAVRGKVVAISQPKKGVVQFFDGDSGTLQREVAVENAAALTILPDGTLLGVQPKGGLFRVPVGATVAELLHAPGSPVAIASDTNGRVFLSDNERSNVAVFPNVPLNVTGQLATIGESGGHRPGAWNANRMNVPRAIAVEDRADGKSQLWVVEDSYSPRRISVWDAATRQFLHDYVGNTRYSASGGFLSDDVPGIGFVDGVKFRVAMSREARQPGVPPSGEGGYAERGYEPLEVLGGAPQPVAQRHNAFTLGKGAGNFANPYHFVSIASGQEREYIVEAGGTQPMIFMKRGERWQCVAALGTSSRSDFQGVPRESPLRSGWNPKLRQAFSWQDANGDGHQQADEVVWHDLGVNELFQCGWGYRCGRDLVFYHSGFAFRPVRFSADGAPVYDASKAERLPGELGQVKGDIHKTRFGYVADTSTGEVVDKLNVIHGLHFVTGFDEAGQIKWKYPNYWVAVHGAFTAPMAMPGVMMGVLKTSGVIAPVAGSLGDAATFHDIISLRGNIGQEFLIRDDGLYVGELFTDQRMAPADLPPTRDIVGAPINETTLGGEPFNGWIGRQRDGKVRMTFGYTDVRIAEVVGLDRITDLPPLSITIGEPELAAARAFKPKPAAVRKTEADIPRGVAFTDADLAQPEFFADANGPLVIRSGREEMGRARLRWDDAGLHLAVQVADATPLVNKGTSGPMAFKSGDSVSLFACPLDAATPRQQGGTRVLFASLKGKPTTMLYRPVGPGDSRFVFESPVRQSPFAHVAEAGEIKFAAHPGNGSYSLRTTIPWAELLASVKKEHGQEVHATAGLKLRGDIGLLFGDDSGANTAQRVHWVDRETNVVNDVPTEAEFFPDRWGTWTLLGGRWQEDGER